MFDIGKYYSCPDYYLLVYPTKKVAKEALVLRPAAAYETEAERVTKYWSKQLKCKINHTQPEHIFYLIKKIKEGSRYYLFCIFPNLVGWIIWEDWIKLKEVN